MRKKYLSALLFGALLFASAGTFTSCKDYDDDINNLQTQIDDVKTAIAELQSKVDGGKYVTDVAKEGDGIKITWSDNTSSVIETIKGADGTIVTMGENGNWFIDGEDTGVSYKGEKGEAGEQGPAGEAGEQGPAGEAGADGHDAQISEDGYWMVWDAEAGEYVKTKYVAGGVIAVETVGGWNLTVNDETGATQTIFVPSSSTMGYIDVLGNDLANYPTFYGLTSMQALYGINEKDVEYGPADAKKTLQKGLYTTLDRDLMIVVNPQGTDASDYTFSLTNSANQSTGLKFKDAVPYEGVLSRATSTNGVWVLPHDFTRYEDIEDARTKNYLLFKANDGEKHALSLTATLNNTTVKTPYDLGASLKKIGEVTVKVDPLTNCAVGKEYVPTYAATSIDANAVELYGAEIVNDGHAFTYTRETGVNNSVKLVYNYILMDGTVVEGEKAPTFIAAMREEMAAEKTQTLERLNVAFEAELVDAKDNPFFTNVLSAEGRYNAQGKYEFVMNTKAYSLAELMNGMSDVEKVVWNSAIEHNSIAAELIGGEGDNNVTETNTANLRNIGYSYSAKDNTIIFQFAVSAGYRTNFLLDNAYQLTFTALDEDTNTPVASVVLPFEFTMPDCPVTRDYDKSISADKSILWIKEAEDKNGNDVLDDVLKVYGEKDPSASESTIFGDLRDAFIGAFKNEAGKYEATIEAGYYNIYVNGVNQDKFLLGQFNSANNPVTLDYITPSSLWSEWNTFQHFAQGGQFAEMQASKVVYKHYGVYEEELPMFYVKFASKIEDSKEPVYNTVSGQTGNGEEATPLMAQTQYNNGNLESYVVTLTDANFTLKDAFGYEYKLFDKVTLKNDGTASEAIRRNAINNMWANDREGIDDNAIMYGLNPIAKVDGQVNNSIQINLIDARGNVITNVATQYPTGLKVVIPASVAAAKNNLVEVTLNITDVFGHVYQLPVYIQTVK